MKENKTNRCGDIEELLIKQKSEILSEKEIALLQNHLKTCKHCQSYQTRLAYIQASMPISKNSPLKPDPAIRQSLINRMKALKPQKYWGIDSLRQKILTVLEYRIPVYQGLIGLACSWLIFVAIQYFSFLQSRSVSSEYYRMMSDAKYYQINVIQNLQIIEQQKIGKTVREDSLLTRFVVSSM